MNPGPATGAESLASEMRAREFDKLCKREFSWDHVPLFEGTRRVLVRACRQLEDVCGTGSLLVFSWNSTIVQPNSKP